MSQIKDKALKAIMDAPNLRHNVVTEEHIKLNGGKPVLGHAKYYLKQSDYSSAEIPELLMLEDAILGFLTGSSFVGSVECKASLNNLVYYGFEIVENREIYNPSKAMKAGIAAQKFTEAQAIFYA
jgi:hypothetical protein